jgi:aspartyl/asparaginyl beta-hydroxylase
MLNTLQLPFQFDPARLQLDLASIQPSDWVRHFNTREYEGDWSAVPLRSVDGKTGHIYPDPTAGTDRFADTPLLQACPYFQEVVAAFECPKQSVRLLRLGAGSLIREHRDYCLGFGDSELRIHIPVVTSPEVEFYVAGQRVVLSEGEAWYIDFNLPHRLYNGGSADRIHLVIDCVVNDWMRSLFFAQNFEEFRKKVLDEPSLQTQFRDAPDGATLIPLLLQAGQQHGYTFGPAEVESAIGAARGEWLASQLP